MLSELKDYLKGLFERVMILNDLKIKLISIAYCSLIFILSYNQPKATTNPLCVFRPLGKPKQYIRFFNTSNDPKKVGISIHNIWILKTSIYNPLSFFQFLVVDFISVKLLCMRKYVKGKYVSAILQTDDPKSILFLSNFLYLLNS